MSAHRVTLFECDTCGAKATWPTYSGLPDGWVLVDRGMDGSGHNATEHACPLCVPDKAP